MAEFAALFGKEKSWAYRQKYDGKIDVITDYGVDMVPASQVKRIEENAGRYLGRKKAKKEAPKRKSQNPPAPVAPTGKGGKDAGKVLKALDKKTAKPATRSKRSAALKRMGRKPPPR